VIRISNSWPCAALAPDKVEAGGRFPFGCAVLVVIVLSLLGWAILLILLLRLFNGVTSLSDARGSIRSRLVKAHVARLSTMGAAHRQAGKGRGSAVGAAVEYGGLATDAHRRSFAGSQAEVASRMIPATTNAPPVTIPRDICSI
jgi:hypothetical protein